MRKDEYILTKELRRLAKYGLLLQAKRVGFLEDEGYKYNILFTEDKRVLEPECGVSEVMGIINSLEICLELMGVKEVEDFKSVIDKAKKLNENETLKNQAEKDIMGDQGSLIEERLTINDEQALLLGIYDD